MLRPLAWFFIWLTGWKVVGTPAPKNKSVMVVAYHTSNWDAFICLIFNVALRARVSFAGKQSLFWWPLGPFLKFLGGIPVIRDSKGDFVSKMVEQFRERAHLVLAIAPEGTRGNAHFWKTGFYYIALNAGVPLQLAALDYGRKKFVFSDLINVTGDIQKDIACIREFFRPTEPKFPQLADKDFEIKS